MKPRSKEFHYDVDVTWTGERKGKLQAEGKPDLEVATPPEFKGHPGIWSPEDYFVSAISACLMSTFLGMSERANLRILAYRDHAKGTLQQVDGFLQFTHAVVQPHIVVASDADAVKALEILRKAKDDCLVARSLKTLVALENPQIEVDATPLK